ncbi:plp-dependent transferase [Fusarium mundagurra]|uniref:Plp-dependent transferase n=1 Tax=Fusarium mundagurra TaxID=1567541 RepID=A0A8H5XXC3_9HYPO|nr:plp-dependent transferase [Fusarium mundagurra]
MDTIEDTASVATTAAEHHLSTRGAQGLLYRDVWGPREKSMGNPWSPNNPGGIIILRLAENSLMHDEVGKFIKEQVDVLPLNHLTYSTGPRGSHRLRRAAAAFWMDEFKPHNPIGVDNIFITPGLSSAIDGLVWSICDEGDAILIPLPRYNGFSFDVFNRSNARIIGVPYTGVEGYSTLDDLFDPEPPETLKVFASICGEHGLHLISDEIYAKSVFPEPAICNAVPFVSTLSLDLGGVIDKTRHHVLYGASKDFCANGLRLGFVCTQNKGIMGAMSSISIFSWSSHIIQDTWAAMLEDRQWLQTFTEKKLELMVENHKIATSFFHDHGIQFYNTNAGLFIWMDLRYLLTLQTSTGEADLSAISSEVNTYKQQEIEIMEKGQGNGVMIAPGHAYLAEEYGWFRLTFTVGKDALKEGLNRLWKTLQEIKEQKESA